MKVVKVSILILLVFTGCASAQKRATADRSKSVYKACLLSTAEKYSAGTESPNDIVTAAEAKCQPEFKSMLEQIYPAAMGENHYIWSTGEGRTRAYEEADEFRTYLHSRIVQAIVEKRLEKR